MACFRNKRLRENPFLPWNACSVPRAFILGMLISHDVSINSNGYYHFMKICRLCSAYYKSTLLAGIENKMGVLWPGTVRFSVGPADHYLGEFAGPVVFGGAFSSIHLVQSCLSGLLIAVILQGTIYYATTTKWQKGI